ncbi:palmdelphin isoform X1 [Gasterosteus aculeatus]
MEESALLKERLQAITEKHRIQEDIRQRKLELDREKVKLQHLKKKALRERWLLQDSTSHNANQQRLLSDQQQTRALQLNIHRTEMEVQSLEREEFRISTNESFILNRLKAVERSPGDVIKEAQDRFVAEPLLVSKFSPDVPESPSPPANKHCETNTPGRTLFAMEINVTRKLLTGPSTVLSTASVQPEKVDQRAGLEVYHHDRKCVYALNSQQGSHDHSCASELSANEVEQLLRSATAHRQVNHLGHSRGDEKCCFEHQDEREGVEGFDLRDQRGCYGSHLLRNPTPEKGFNEQSQPGVQYHYGGQESLHRQQEERMNQSNLREGHRLGNHMRAGHPLGNRRDRHCSSYQVRNCHCVQEGRPASHHTCGIMRANGVVNRGRANGRPPPRSHDQGTGFDCSGQLCYTPANYIPLSDYISVDEEELYGHAPPSRPSHDGRTTAALCSGPAPSDRAPSPIYGENIPYTILNALETTEPITAIFMGFQAAQDDSCRGRQFEGSLKAELVVIDDNADCSDDHGVKEKERHDNGCPTGGSSNGNGGRVDRVGDRWKETRVGSGVRKMPNKHRPCCTVC